MSYSLLVNGNWQLVIAPLGITNCHLQITAYPIIYASQTTA
jgi:hypothetical protein